MNTSRLNALSYRSQQNLFCRCPDAKANFGSKLIPLTMQLELYYLSYKMVIGTLLHILRNLSMKLSAIMRFTTRRCSPLEEWRHYLRGAIDVFKIWTDHQNLQYFRQPQKVNRRQARWLC